MTINVYAVDAEGNVHDVAYDLPADEARAMAKTIDGGVAASEPPTGKKVKDLAKDAAASDG